MADISNLTREELLERKSLLERKIQLESQISETTQTTVEEPKEISPEQRRLEEGSLKVRQAIGRVTSPAGLIGGITDIFSGRLAKRDPLAVAGGEFVLSALDTAAFGVPRAALKTALGTRGLQLPKVQNKAADAAGKIAGLLVPAKIATSIATKIPGLAGRGILKGAARGVTEGTAIGFTTSPEEFTDIQQRVLQSGIGGAIGGVAVPLAKGVQNLTRVTKDATKFAQKVRGSLFQFKRDLGKQFESQLDSLIEANKGKIINAENSVINLKEAIKTNSKIVTDIRAGARRTGDDLLQRLIEAPESARNLTLSQSRQMIKQIRNIPSIKSNLKKGKFSDFSESDIDLLDFVDDVKGEQLDVFPELQAINQQYSQGIGRYNLVKNKFKVGQLLDNIEKNFKDAEVRNVVKELLPKNVIQEMGGFRSAKKFLKAASWISAIGMSALVGGAVFRGTRNVSES